MIEPWTSEADAKLAALEVALETMAKERDRLLDDLNRETGFNNLLRIERDGLAKDLAAARAEVVSLRALVGEVVKWHSDPNSPDYNECDKARCLWCEEALVATSSAEP